VQQVGFSVKTVELPDGVQPDQLSDADLWEGSYLAVPQNELQLLLGLTWR